MTSDTQHAESGSSIGRRTFIKGVGATGAAGIGLSGRSPGPGSGGAVGGAQALPPVAVGLTAGAAAWAVREIQAELLEEPTDGLGPEALQNQVYQIARARESTNASTIVDNSNIADGMRHIAYTDGKIAAIEELNQENSLEDVQSAAEDAAGEYIATVEKNLLKTWNEAVEELESLVSNVRELDELSQYDVFDLPVDIDRESDIGSPDYPILYLSDMEDTWDVELANGETFDTKYLSSTDPGEWDNSGDATRWSPTEGSTSNLYRGGGIGASYVPDTYVRYEPVDGSSRSYMNYDDWGPIWDEIQDVRSEVFGGLQNWTANVYADVQSGSIDVSNLLTPREQAELLADDEEYPQAVADLIALNIPVDPDREATISFTEQDITISGLMAPTSPPEDGFTVGETYDPSAEPWDLYFTYDPSRGSGGWSEYEERISEGALRFTEEPYASVLYRVPTNLGTVEVVSDDFEEADDGVWTADVSDQLGRPTEEWTDFQTGVDGGTVTFGSLPDEPAEFDITTNQGDTETVIAEDFEADDDEWTVETSLGIAEVESVTAHIDRATIEEAVSVYAEDGSADYETVQISDEFTLDRLEDSDGNEVESTEFSRTEPQDDENYITQEEWDDLEQQNQELIDTYEEATSSDDGLFGGGGFDFGEFGEVPTGATAAAAGVAVVVVIVGVLRQVASFYLPGR